MKKYLPLFVTLLVTAAVPVSAASLRSDYYDWGSYYQPVGQVLGITFSSHEGLPPPPLSPDLLPPPATGILPGDFFAPAESWAESLQLTFTFNSLAREQLRLQFASERLAEAQTLITQQRFTDAAIAVSAYRNSMQTLASNVQNLAQTDSEQATQLLQQVETTVANQTVVAQTLAASAPPAVAETWSQVLTASEGVLDAVADATHQPPIPEDLSAGIQELKSQGLITGEESAKLYAITNRSDVRDELDKLVTSGQFPPAEAAKLDTAVAANHPDIFEHQQDVLEFAELRSYQTLASPDKETAKKIAAWQANPSDLPPPAEIRPYLYYDRAQDLAQTVDMNRFSTDQQAEIAKFYPQAAVTNLTFSQPSPLPSPTPQPASDQPPVEPAASPINPYLTAPTGPLPGDLTYFFKRLGENISTTLTFAPTSKAELLGQLAEERLREANALASQADRSTDYIRALKDYDSTLTTATKIVDSFNRPTPSQQDIAQVLENQVARHNLIFERGLLPPPADQPKLVTILIEATQDALDTSADTLGRPALPPALSDRLQDLKAQGLILPEEVNSLTAAGSRGEVRDQIRKLEEEGSFPPAEAKRMDEAQSLVAPGDYNQLVEVRKIEELNQLRAIQTDFAQTATLKATANNLDRRLDYLKNSIDPSLIQAADLAGNDKLQALYQQLVDNPNRPVNAGQFPASAGGSLALTPADTVLTTCPAGAIFKQLEGCVWATNGQKLNDYNQYRCTGGQYWSFAAQGCVSYQSGYPNGQPICPVGYEWTWSSQTCTKSTSKGSSPSPVPTVAVDSSPRPDQCPKGSSYQAPQGCVWDDTDRPVNDSTQYRCSRAGQYYSFTQKGCVDQPTTGQTIAVGDAVPECANTSDYWSWSESRCLSPLPPPSGDNNLAVTSSTITPTSPFYFLDRAVETIQIATAFSPESKEKVRLAQAQERLGEAYTLLQNGEQERFRTVLGDYTTTMQTVYNDLGGGIKLSDAAATSLGEQLANQTATDNLILQKATALATKTEAASALSTATSVTIQGIDRAADLTGEPAIPTMVQDRLDSLPPNSLTDEQKKLLDQADTRLEARLAINTLVAGGILNAGDTAVLDQKLSAVNPIAAAAVAQLRSLAELEQIQTQSTELKDKVSENEDIAKKLSDFQTSFTPGSEIPTEIRPYIRLSRIDEVSQTIRPDIVRLEDFANRQDVQLAVATLREEFRPTPQLLAQVSAYRRSYPGQPLPPDLARLEALSTSLGVRDRATACFLPSPPFAANTPCPPPGAALPFSTYYSPSNWPGTPSFGYQPPTATGATGGGEQLTYGKGPEVTNPGVCPNGYHWMYDSGGWCMSNGGNYAPNTPISNYTSTGPGYTPYSPYYSPPGTTYPGSGSYSPPYYYGSAPTNYTTNPPPGTVPGTGPAPTSPGQCPSGYHWMSDSGGWCMADAPTYVPGGASGYNYGSQPQSCISGQSWSPAAGGCIPTGSTPGYYSPNLTQSSCGPGYYWDGRGCIPTYGGTGNYSPSSYQSGCTPGNYWDGTKCVAGSYEGSGWSDTTARSGSWCQPPSSGCGSNNYWDYGSCSCRSSSTYSGGGGATPSNSCQGLSCGGGSWPDYSTCSCRYSSDTSTPTYSPPPSGSSGSSSGSCPSGYHWMSDSGGWCMSDGAAPSGGSSSPPPSTPAPAPSTEPAPAPSTEPAPSSAPPPSEPAPAPSSSEPAPTTSP